MPKFRAVSSRLTLAIALAVATAVGLGAVATPAYAAKKKEETKTAKADYSKPFVAAYQPLATALKAEGDLTPLKAQVDGLVAAASTADDKMAAGQFVYQVGEKTGDMALQRRGLDLMLDSGRFTGQDYAKNLFAAASLAYNAKDWATAQRRGQQAIDAGYTGDAELMLAETYFAQNQVPQGLTSLDTAIAKKVAANQPVPEAWLKRGLAQAYQADLQPQAYKYSGMYAQYYPSTNSWGDAIAIQRNMGRYEGADLLDIMRLGQRTKSLRAERDYLDYIDAADARRLPGETQRIIEEGLAAGKLRANSTLVMEAKSTASGRVKTDMADLPKIERDARAASATAATVAVAGDIFLSYQQPAKAEEFYKIALSKPGVDTARVLTRLGIAQADQGKKAEAAATFAKVQGARQAIAQLWAIYAAQAAAPATTAAM